MNKSESKYFNTALRMDEAIITLLEKKDLEYITVKELCHLAGVNRSTFYLHYDTVSDLVNEAAEMVNRRFLSYFPRQEEEILQDMDKREQEELILVTGEFLLPYLCFIKDNKKIYRASFRNPGGMHANRRYEQLKQHILHPILARFQIPDTPGWQIYGQTAQALAEVEAPGIDKLAFGMDLSDPAVASVLPENADEIELVGLVSNICVLSNAVVLQSRYPQATVMVDAACTASFDPDLHQKTLGCAAVHIYGAIISRLERQEFF